MQKVYRSGNTTHYPSDVLPMHWYMTSRLEQVRQSAPLTEFHHQQIHACLQVHRQGEIGAVARKKDEGFLKPHVLNSSNEAL